MGLRNIVAHAIVVESRFGWMVPRQIVRGLVLVRQLAAWRMDRRASDVIEGTRVNAMRADIMLLLHRLVVVVVATYLILEVALEIRDLRLTKILMMWTMPMALVERVWLHGRIVHSHRWLMMSITWLYILLKLRLLRLISKISLLRSVILIFTILFKYK